jgi:DNA (cytosine-5)-methyltransferase 1
MIHGSLFSGIGGFDLAAEWVGWENKFHCEINTFGQKILKYYWPDAETFTDITKTDFTKYANKIDVISGGFPCQPYSQAGKRKGKNDERHLWPEMLRAIREISPRWVVGENVRGLTNWNGGMVFDEVQSDLEVEGYEVLPFLLPACAVNAPHRRDRIWFIATNTGLQRQEIRQEQPMGANELRKEWDATNTECERLQKSEQSKQQQPLFNAERNDTSIAANTGDKRLQGMQQFRKNEITNRGRRTSASGAVSEFYSGSDWQNFPTQSPLCGRNDGLSTRLAGITFPKHRNESIKAYGNAVVPQVVYQIFKAIQQYGNANKILNHE